MIGILDNGKHKSDVLLREVQELSRPGEVVLKRCAPGVGRRDHLVEVRGEEEPLVERLGDDRARVDGRASVDDLLELFVAAGR